MKGIKNSVTKIVLAGVITLNTVGATGVAAESENSTWKARFSAPTAAQIGTLITQNGGISHPCVIADRDAFGNIKALETYDEKLKAYNSSILAGADKYIGASLPEYKMSDSIRMNGINNVGSRMVYLCYAYKISGDEKYAAEAWRVISDFCSWSDWNPYQMLGVGEAMYNCALAYDWLYDYLDNTQKTTIKNAVKEKAWVHYLNDMEGKSIGDGAAGRTEVPYVTPGEELKRSTLWTTLPRQNNWNFVINSGVILSAIAIGEGDEYSKKLLEYAIADLPDALEGYGENGAWFEGIGYWDYGTRYFVYLAQTLENALGTDYTLSDYPGFTKTGSYYKMVTGYDGVFNYSDATADDAVSPASLFWLANKTGDSALWRYANSVADEKTVSVNPYLAIAYANSSRIGDNSYSYTVPAKQMAAIRSDESENYIAMHSGANNEAHGHIDIGSFVLDMLGTRFAMDLGSENYNLSGGYNLYRRNAQGHNVVVFDPKNSGYGQLFDGSATVGDYAEYENEGYMISDLSGAYSSDLVSAYKRGIKATDKKNVFVIQDEFTPTTTINELYWFMHTDADIVLSADMREATLTKDGVSVKAKILSSAGSFAVLEPVGLTGTETANFDGQTGENSKEGIRKLSIRLENVSQPTTIAVGIIPVSGYTYPAVMAIDSWNLSESSEPYATGIKINNVDLSGFESDKTYYKISAAEIPEVEVAAEYPVSVEYPACIPGNLNIYVKNGIKERKYTVRVDSGADCSGLLSVRPKNVSNNRIFDGDVSNGEYAYSRVYNIELGECLKNGKISIYGSGSDAELGVSISEDGLQYNEIYYGKAFDAGNNIVIDALNKGFSYVKLYTKKVAVDEVKFLSEIDGGKCSVMVAVYTADKVLKSVETYDETVFSKKLDYSRTIENGEFIRVFVWNDTNRLVPLADMNELEL